MAGRVAGVARDQTCAGVLSPEAARALGRVRSRRPTCAAGSDRDLGARQSRDSPWRFGAVSAAGRGGLEARLSLLDPASLLAIRVVSGGGGIRTPEGPNGPLRFSRLHAFGSTMRPQARCATQRATVRVQRARAHRSPSGRCRRLRGCSAQSPPATVQRSLVAAGPISVRQECPRGGDAMLAGALSATCGTRASRPPSLRRSGDATTSRGC
jgi:hypothetical protein